MGRNGSGKSNFLDALRFVADALRTSLDHAITSRGGPKVVCHRGRRTNFNYWFGFGLEFELELTGDCNASYALEVAAGVTGKFSVKKEALTIRKGDSNITASYYLEDGTLIRASQNPMPPAAIDRLYLVNAAGLPEFREVYDSLLMMGFYNLNPESMRTFQSPDAGEILRHDGGNLASAIGRIERDAPEIKERIKGYLKTIVPEITAFERVDFGPAETLYFDQRTSGSESSTTFFAASMSDGTLRALGILVAVMQLAEGSNPVRLVGIEEPETALHPAACGALMDALREAGVHTQVIVTTHSPDLLNQVDTAADTLLAVQMTDGRTQIAPIDNASLQSIKEHLYLPGELLAMDQLEPDPKDLERQRHSEMFEFTKDPA